MKHRGTEVTEGIHRGLTGRVIGAAIEVHRALGPGLLESAYRACLCRELVIRGMRFEKEVPLPVVYKGVRVNCGYRIDLLVEEVVILELKAVTAVPAVAYAQLLTYLRLTGIRLGLLINFNAEVLRTGVKRVING